jgi:serine/threonine-protein kinase
LDSSASRDVALDLPKRIGRYEPFFQIGAGGMARVYLAVHHGPFDSRKLVVVKQLRQEIDGDDNEFLESFVNEARIALRLSHPNVIHTYEVVAEERQPFLAMEYLEGQSLLHVLRVLGRLVMPLEEHLWILTQVLAGLHYAHELRDFNGSPLGVVHRDVSPSNVLICYSGEVKLLDFGIAKAAGALGSTQESVVKGKIGYAAPEQCLGKPADRRADVYAVGVMLWEAVAGRRRSSGETWSAMLQARLQDSEPPLEQVRPGAPPELTAITRRALARDPETRYSTAQEFQRDLELYLSRQGRQIGPGDLSTLLASRFVDERARVGAAIERHFGEPHVPGVPISGPIAVSAGAPAVANRNASAFVTGDEEDTSRIPVDGALLRALREEALAEERRRASMPPPEARGPTRRMLWAALAVVATAVLGFVLARSGKTTTVVGAAASPANASASASPSALAGSSATGPSERPVTAPSAAIPTTNGSHSDRGSSSAHGLRYPRVVVPPRSLPERPQAQATSTQVEPGMELPAAGTRPKRVIDEKDPYAQ